MSDNSSRVELEMEELDNKQTSSEENEDIDEENEEFYEEDYYNDLGSNFNDDVNDLGSNFNDDLFKSRIR